MPSLARSGYVHRASPRTSGGLSMGAVDSSLRTAVLARKALVLGVMGAQGPKKNQIQWTVLDSPGRKATPIFRGRIGRAACGPSRDQSRLCGFDSRRLHIQKPSNLTGLLGFSIPSGGASRAGRGR